MNHPEDHGNQGEYPEIPDHLLAPYSEDVKRLEQEGIGRAEIVETVISWSMMNILQGAGFHEVGNTINRNPPITINARYESLDRSTAIVYQSNPGNQRIMIVGLSAGIGRKPEQLISEIRQECANRAIPAEIIFMLDGRVLAEDTPPQPPPTRYLEAAVAKEFPWYLSLKRGSYLITSNNEHLIFLYREDPPKSQYHFMDAATQEPGVIDMERFETMCQQDQIRSMDEPMDLDEFLQARFEEARRQEEHFRNITTESRTRYRQLGL